MVIRLEITDVELMMTIALSVATICFIAFLAFMSKRDKRTISALQDVTKIRSLDQTSRPQTIETTSRQSVSPAVSIPKLVMCGKCGRPFDMKNAVPVADPSTTPPRTRYASPCCFEMVPEGI